MNQLLWSQKTRIQFVINNSLAQGNIFKIHITSSVFTKSSILDIWLGSQQESDYPGIFLLLEIQTSTSNLPRIFLMRLVFYLSISSRKFLFSCSRIMFQTYLNLTTKNQKSVDKAVLVFFIANWGYGNMYFGSFHYCFDGFH